MSSGFSNGFTDLYTPMNNSRFRSPLTGVILSDPSSQIAQQRPDLIGKRSLAEFQAHQQLQMFQQQNQLLGIHHRNVKPRTYQQSSPVSPLSPVDFYASISPETNQNTISSNSRYGFPILQQLRPQSQRTPNYSTLSYPNLVQNRAVKNESVGQESEKKMMDNKLQELEKQLLNDDDDEEVDDSVSIVTNEWSDTIQSLISPSPTSSSSNSCTSSLASPQTICPKQSLTEAAFAISEGKNDVASEILTRLNQVSNVIGTSEQRLIAYMTKALRRRVNNTENPPPVTELYSKEHIVSTQMLYEVSPCFKLGFMAANLAILETISNHQNLNKLHVVDFDIGSGGQYVHLIHALAAGKVKKPIALKITTFSDFTTEEKLKLVRESLMGHANKLGVDLNFNLLSLKICDLSFESLGVEIDEALAVNFAFRLYKLPDESVTTENLRDELLRRVKGLSPAVVTVVEQEMNANTAPFVARVTEACGYYGSLFDSLDATVPRDNSERVRIEEGLSRKLANSVACEGRDRVERCEVFGKWRARLGMAGFKPNPLSQNLADSLNSKLNSGTRGNPGFTVKEENGGLCFGWMGRTLTVASAWH